MKNKIITVLLLALTLSMTACSSETSVVAVNVEEPETVSGNKFGLSALVKIGDGLYYDSTTLNVYWWNGLCSAHVYSSTVPTPYLAPNGFAYKYNPETNTFYENDVFMKGE